MEDDAARPGAGPALPGTPAPDFRAPSSKGHTLGPELFQDRLAVVLAFLDGIDGAEHLGRGWAFDALLPEFGRRRVQLLCVVPGTARQVREEAEGLAVTLLADEDGSIRDAFGATGAASAAVVIDRFGAVAAVLRGDEAAPHAVLATVDRLLDERPEALGPRPDTPAG